MIISKIFPKIFRLIAVIEEGMAKYKTDPTKLARFRSRCAYNAERALDKFLWNANRVAGVVAKDTEEEKTAKFVALVLNGSDQEKRIARARLKDFA
jgi:hypothetical protein